MIRITKLPKALLLSVLLLAMPTPSQSANIENLEIISKKLATELVEFLSLENRVAMVRPDLSAVGLGPFDTEVVTQNIEMALEQELTGWDFNLIEQSAFQAWIDYSAGSSSNAFDPRVQVEAAKDAGIDALLVTRITNLGAAYRVYLDVLDIHQDGAGFFKTKSYLFSPMEFMTENVVVDRRRGVIWAKGVGYPNRSFPKPVWNKSAETAAIIYAKAKLAEVVSGGRLESKTVVRNFQLISNEIKTHLVAELPRSHQVGATLFGDQGVAMVVVEMSLDK